MSADGLPSQDIINEFVGVSHGNLARVQELLAQYPSLVNGVSIWGETPIQAAAQIGQREIANLLLAAGAPLDICTAAMLGERERVADFLRADPQQAHATGAHGLPVMYYPAINGRTDIAELLLAHGAAVNGGDGVSSPLHCATNFGQTAMAEWLLAHGAHPNALDFQHKSALQLAIEKNRSDIADAVRRHGGKALASGMCEVNGSKLYYETMGEGHALVLIHAGVADSRMWDGQFAAFAERYRVVRYDMRGFGQSHSESGAFSFRQDLADLLKHLNIEKIFLLGLSMGGQIATDFTLEHPELVAALMPCAAGLSGYDSKVGDDAKSQFESKAFAEMEAAWEQKDRARLLELELDMWVEGPQQARGRAASSVRERVREMNSDVMKHTEELTSQRLDPPAVGRLGEIRGPTLVIVGDLDTTSVLEACDLLASGIAGARQVVIPGTAHMLNMEQPAEFNRIVLDFLSAL